MHEDDQIEYGYQAQEADHVQDSFVRAFEAKGQGTNYGLTPPSAQERAKMAALFDQEVQQVAAATPVQESKIQAFDLPAAGQAAAAPANSDAPDTNAMNFGAAFKHFRKSGAKEFTWRGKSYSTALANETPAKPKATTEQPAVAKPTSAQPEPAATTAPKAVPVQEATPAIIAPATAPANNSPNNIFPYNRSAADQQRMNERAQRHQEQQERQAQADAQERQQRIEAARQAQKEGRMFPKKQATPTPQDLKVVTDAGSKANPNIFQR